MQSDISQLQQQVAACCTIPSDDGTRSFGVGEDHPLDPKPERLLNIQPNPFIAHTTISYILERAGRAMLMVNSGDGKQLQVLDQADRSEGEYRFEWSTGHLAPRVYYVTLLLDGEPLVKRAVKVR